MKLYKKKPIPVEVRGPLTESEIVVTAHGRVRAEAGDFVLTDIKTKDTWPIKPDFFTENYETLDVVTDQEKIATLEAELAALAALVAEKNEMLQVAEGSLNLAGEYAQSNGDAYCSEARFKDAARCGRMRAKSHASIERARLVAKVVEAAYAIGHITSCSANWPGGDCCCKLGQALSRLAAHDANTKETA